MSKETNKKSDIKCLYCGNNPVSHNLTKIDNWLFSFINPFAHFILKTFFGRFILFVLDKVFLVFLFLGGKVGFIKFIEAPLSLDSDRGQVLMEEARSRGYKTEVLKVAGHIHDTYRVTFKNGKKIMFEGLPRVSRVNALTSAWMDDKLKMKKVLQTALVSVPLGDVAKTFSQARKIFSEIPKPVIVKPRFGSRGRHTTTNINNESDLKIAYTRAKQLSTGVIVESHLVGSVYRATIVNGKLVGVLAGDPPRITGDGHSTIAKLIELKNQNKPERVAKVLVTDKHLEFLSNQGYSLETVLPKDITIDLTEKIGLSYGGASREVTGVTNPKLVVELEKAAKAVGDAILGFDFISSDIEVDPSTVKWGIIECNSVPFINLHHDPLIGTPVNAAAKVWDWVEQELNIKK